MPDARESHTWVSRCFGLIFTAMKTQKVKTGRQPGEPSVATWWLGGLWHLRVGTRPLLEVLSRPFLGPSKGLQRTGEGSASRLNTKAAQLKLINASLGTCGTGAFSPLAGRSVQGAVVRTAPRSRKP